MEQAQIKVEVERVTNLVAGFGWFKTEEKISEGKITITLEKSIPVPIEKG